MGTLLGEWVGKRVKLTLRLGGLASAVTLDGKLLQAEESGVMFELPEGRTFVPVTAILHITLPRDK
jgi:hypothetical protein